MDKKIMIMLIVVFILIGVVFIYSNSGLNVGQAIKNSPEYADESGIIKIPLSDISQKAKFYEYDSNGVKVQFFVIKAADGSVKTAFNACDVCFRSKKGYRQKGIDMICNNCGNYYPISGLGTKNLRGGGCWPGYLPSKVVGDNLIIKKSDLEKGEFMFR